MKNFQHWIWMISITLPAFSMAQPPEEEVAPVAPEFNIEITDAPAPDQQAPAAAPATNSQLTPALTPGVVPAAQALTTPAATAPAPTQLEPSITPGNPIAVPGAPAAPAIAEDKSVKGISLAPSIGVVPMGLDPGAKQLYVEFDPSVALDAVFKTAQNRDVAINVSYNFGWQEFLSKRDQTLRSFSHKVIGSGKIKWAEIFSSSLESTFEYALAAGLDRGHAVTDDSFLKGIFTIGDQVVVTTAYHLFYFNGLDSKIFLSSLPTDSDEVRQNNIAISGSEPFFDPTDPAFEFDPAVGNLWYAFNGLSVTPKYTPIKGTSVSAGYEYVFMTFTNTPSTDWHGHYITANLTQDLPWKGGNVSLTEQIRLRNYIANPIEGAFNKSDLRNRLTFVLSQSITDSIAAEFFYRWEINGSNADNYEKLAHTNHIQLSFTYSF